MFFFFSFIFMQCNLFFELILLPISLIAPLKEWMEKQIRDAIKFIIKKKKSFASERSWTVYLGVCLSLNGYLLQLLTTGSDCFYKRNVVMLPIRPWSWILSNSDSVRLFNVLLSSDANPLSFLLTHLEPACPNFVPGMAECFLLDWSTINRHFWSTVVTGEKLVNHDLITTRGCWPAPLFLCRGK